MKLLSMLLMAVLALIAVLFSVLNSEPVNINYYFATSNSPLSLILIIAIVIGFILGVLAFLGLIVRLKSENTRLRKEATLAEKEVANLRRIPLRDKD